jgi:hypothetical protein
MKKYLSQLLKAWAASDAASDHHLIFEDRNARTDIPDRPERLVSVCIRIQVDRQIRFFL